MKGDYSRFSFDKKKRYSAVLMQQGRLQLDSDWNEQVQIAEHRNTALFRDLVGRSGTPKANAMALTLTDGIPTLSPGVYYIEGLFLENYVPIRLEAAGDLPPVGQSFLYYLDAWTQEINAVEDAELIDSAVGQETTTRLKTEWRLRHQPITAAEVAAFRGGHWPKEGTSGFPATLASETWWRAFSTGKLKMKSRPGADAVLKDNRLYRIEVHEGSPDVLFKWSRNNASICAEVEATDEDTYALTTNHRHMEDFFKGSAWIELCVPGETTGHLLEVQLEGGSLTLDAGTPERLRGLKKAIIRRWDGTFCEEEENALADELGADFEYEPQGFYRAGDYWLILIRGGQILNWESDEEKPPEGVEHRFAALGVLNRTSTAITPTDLRVLFDPLTDPNLSTTGGAGIGEDLHIGGKLTVGGTATVSGAFSATSTANVTGNTTVGGALTVNGTGASRIGGPLTVVGALTASSTASITGNTTVGGALTVNGTGASSIAGPLTLAGNTTVGNATSAATDNRQLNVYANATLGTTAINRTLTVNGAASISGALTANSTANITGATTIGGALTVNGTGASRIGGPLTVVGALTASATASITGDTTVGGALTVNGTGASKIGGPLTVVGALAASATANITGATTIGGDLQGTTGSFSTPANPMELLSLGVTPQSLSFESGIADSKTVEVFSKTTWMATSNAAWCTVTKEGTGNAKATVETVQENSGTAARTATLTFTSAGRSRTVSVTQPALLTPVINGFMPAAAAHSTPLIIFGANFSPTPANNEVRLNNVAAVVTAATATQLTVTVPKNLTCGGKISVKVGSKTVSSTAEFDYAVKATVSVFVGSNASVSGNAPVTGTATGTAARFYDTYDVAIDPSGSNLYVVDRGNHCIKKVTIPAGVVSTFVGSTAGVAGYANAAGASARFNAPQSIAIDPSGTNLYVTDSGNHCIRKVTISTGAVSAFVGCTNTAPGVAAYTDSATGSAARFNNPGGIAIDASGSNLYVADYNNHCIRKVVISTGAVSTLAGNSTEGFIDRTGTAAHFRCPWGITIDAAGNLFVTDRDNHCIRKVTPTGVVTTFAGSLTAGNVDGAAAVAQFNYPRSIVFDPRSGNFYVTAPANTERIRKITPQGVVSTIAGSVPGFREGAGPTALLNGPLGLAIDALGNTLYVAECRNHCVRKIVLE